MNTLSSPLRPPGDMAVAVNRTPSAPQMRTRRGDSLIYLGLACLLVLAWKVSRAGLFKPGDDVGYWIGVVGGTMMLLLLLYPLRKYVKMLQGLGRVKHWLWGHMLLGIGGPLLILMHCTFRTGSTNAAVALWSMVVVAASGVVGRVLYTRVNRGLLAERAALRDFKVQANLIGGPGRSRLWFAPLAQARLLDFEEGALSAAAGAGGHWLRLLFILPIESWQVRLRCRREVGAELRRLADGQGWSRAEFKQRRRVGREVIVQHLTCVMRVALFAAWERLFALWHVAHVPFVFLLVGSSVFHIFAVHAY
jgi:hypothetical protein